jgi:hypothetical protein
MGAHQPTLDYVSRRIGKGKNKPEIIRFPKRYVAREVLAIAVNRHAYSRQLSQSPGRYRSFSVDNSCVKAQFLRCELNHMRHGRYNEHRNHANQGLNFPQNRCRTESILLYRTP